MARRLTDKHPHFQKIAAAFAAMSDLGVHVTFMGSNTKISVDGAEYDLEDSEGSDAISECPPIFDFKVVVR